MQIWHICQRTTDELETCSKTLILYYLGRFQMCCESCCRTLMWSPFGCEWTCCLPAMSFQTDAHFVPNCADEYTLWHKLSGQCTTIWPTKSISSNNEGNHIVLIDKCIFPLCAIGYLSDQCTSLGAQIWPSFLLLAVCTAWPWILGGFSVSDKVINFAISKLWWLCRPGVLNKKKKKKGWSA